MAGRGDALARLRGRSEAGFTLIEVMTALVILSITMTAVFATFTSQQQSFTTQNRVAEMQQNLRIALDCMSRDIRMAGYGMPITTNTPNDNVALPSTANPAGISTIRAIYPVDNTTGPDQIYILYVYDMDANQASTTLAAAMGSIAAVSLDNDVTHGFLAGGNELAIVTDGVTADLFQTTGGTATALNFAAGPAYNDSSLHTKLYQAGFPPTVVAKARFVRYFIDNNTLMVDRLIPGQAPQPVADGIEDLQLTYGVDVNLDGAITITEWRNGTGPGEPALDISMVPRIRQVRLSLVARAGMRDIGWNGQRPAIGNRAAGAADEFRRRTMVVDIDVRNSGT